MENKGKYIKLYEEVRQNIIKGIYPYNSKLPSKRVMAEDKNVSVITVSHAYELLAEEGYITPKEKSGYFVSYSALDEFEVPAFTRKAIPKKASNEREDTAFSFPIYAKTLRRVLSDYGEACMMRSPGFGTDELRTAISGYLARSRNINVSKERIIVGSGAEYLYGMIVECLGRRVTYGIESPSYNKIEGVYRAGGATIEMLPLSTDGIESDALWRSEAKVLHVSPYRSFPSGVTASALKKREYIKWSRAKNSIIIEDDFESEFSPLRKPEDTIFSLDDTGRVIYINTFTQTIGSFIRTAYMVLPEALMERFYEKEGFHACPVPTTEQLVLAELINNGDFERHINRVRRQIRKG